MSEECVRVAVRIRPLLPREVLHHHQVCVRVVPDSARVMLGSDRLFAFDHAFGPTATQDEVYLSGVRPLLGSLVDGYNATVFCYGQTGSGKTYTLGGRNQDEEGGIIDRVAQDLFLLLKERRKNSDSVETTVRVSYIELYKEELRDLLELHTTQKELHIREDEKGNTVLVGVKEVAVTSAEELLSVLMVGNALRHTGATGMNEHSSRSHAILTLHVSICCHQNSSLISSKLCLVDLAGSERAGKTANTGTQLKESSHINTGLLALGNVIRALSEQGRNRRPSAHIPYRDAKITRLLRDALGGTARTLMVACVSPSHHFVAETLNVLQFASKARRIHNCPGAVSTQTEIKSCLTTWHPREARLEELEYELQTLRGLLKEKEKDVEMERMKTAGKCSEVDCLDQSSQIRISEPEKVSKEEAGQYLVLAQEAGVLLTDISGPSTSLSFRQRLKDWQERLKAVCPAQQTNKDCSEGDRNETHQMDIFKLEEEHSHCQENLLIKEQLLKEKDSELRQVEEEVEKLLQERRSLLVALEEQKARVLMQSEQLVNQQILIDRLRSNHMAFNATASGATEEARASGYLVKRPNSVPLIRHNSNVRRPPRKIHSSPPVYSLERVIAAFKMRGHLLLAEIEEKDEVYCPFIRQQTEGKDRDQEEKQRQEDSFMDGKGFRHSLNRTWTCRQKKLPLKEKISGQDVKHNGGPLVQQLECTTDTREYRSKENQMRPARGVNAAGRKIHELSVNMCMKEDLIKELDKTEKESQLVDRHFRHSGDGREAGVFARLSMQSHQVRTEVYHSLQHMKQQITQLQSSKRQLREISHGSKELHHSEGQTEGTSTECKDCPQGEVQNISWMEDQEEQVLRRRAELQELEAELKRREEVLLRREACIQQKNKLETKMLRYSQAMSEDLLRVSMRLDTVEEQLDRSRTIREPQGVTIDELEREREMLLTKRDALEAQLKDNRVLTTEEEHSLFQLEEAIEALGAALEFKNYSIQDKHLVPCSSFHPSQSSQPAQFCDVTRRLKELSPSETLELLIKYFNKAVCLRETERCLRLRCEELELHAGEEEAMRNELEAAMQHLALDADRRLTQQHRDHQIIIQQLLKKLKEGASGETQQAAPDRLQTLEKELFFYKSSTRQLKKKLRELLSDALQYPHTQENRQMPCDNQVNGNSQFPHEQT
ncbi:unnamed protein product [Menidia menidia]|uniref:(Atlantic silverside) hypothetical protein n=1 Tax=Menidia menidia TaxID=238744 RepID=A0A8S4B3V6_9TELE|nr:unnamed protein product [Menidia menidia]